MLRFNSSKPGQFLDAENEARQMYVLEISLLLYIHTLKAVNHWNNLSTLRRILHHVIFLRQKIEAFIKICSGSTRSWQF